MGYNIIYNKNLATMEYKDEKIISRIKEVMKEKGLKNQTALSNAVGVKQSSISFMFSLTRSAMPLIEAICEKYHVSKQWLLSGTGMKYVPVAQTIDNTQTDVTNIGDDERVELIRQLNDLYTRHQSIMIEEQEIMKSIVEINKKLLLSGVDIAGL